MHPKIDLVQSRTCPMALVSGQAHCVLTEGAQSGTYEGRFLRVIGQAVESSLCRPLAQLQPTAHLGPGESFGAQRSHTRRIDVYTPPSELLPLRARVAQAGTNPFADQVTLKLRNSGHYREEGLPERRSCVDILLIRDELDSERTELFESQQQVLSAAGESVKTPNEHAVEAPFARVIHQSVERWSALLCAREPSIDILGGDQSTCRLSDHLKSGQRLSLQNRPTEVAGPGPVSFTLPPPVEASQFWCASSADRT